MNEVKALVSVQWKILINRMFGTENTRNKLVDRMILGLLFLLLIIFYMSKLFPRLHEYGSEKMLFRTLLVTEMMIVILIDYVQIVNGSFLSNYYKSMIVFPIQAQKLFFSKVIVAGMINLLIAVYGYFFLLAYAGFAGLGILFDIRLLVGTVGMALLPVLYLNLICLTVFSAVAYIKGNRGSGWNSCILVLGDVFVGIGSYVLFRPHPSSGSSIGILMTSQFWEMPKAVWYDGLLWGMILLGVFLLYFIGGEAYAYVMQSLKFEWKDKNTFGLDARKYDYRKRSQMISYIIRDAKLVWRIPVLRLNCFLFGFLLMPSVAMIALWLFREPIRNSFGSLGIYNLLLIQLLTSLLFFMGNFYGGTSFSKEGEFVNYLKSLPIQKEKVVWLKYLQALGIGVPVVLCANMFIAILPFQKWNFIAFEIYSWCYFLLNPLIILEEDMVRKTRVWSKLEELFGIDDVLKLAKSMFITNGLSFLTALLFDNAGVFFWVMLAIPIIYALICFLRIKQKLKRWYD